MIAVGKVVACPALFEVDFARANDVAHDGRDHVEVDQAAGERTLHPSRFGSEKSTT
jgi:hypothetical protein